MQIGTKFPELLLKIQKNWNISDNFRHFGEVANISEHSGQNLIDAQFIWHYVNF